MVRDPRLLARLARLSAEIAIDTAALVARAEETSALLGAWGSKAALGRADLTLVAANLHGYYTALETLSERVARQLDEHVPAGATGHIDLLSQMQTEVPGLRPAVVPSEVVSELHELRKFRHFFRNAYVLDFDPALVRAHAERLVRIHARLFATLAAFESHLVRTIPILAETP